MVADVCGRTTGTGVDGYFGGVCGGGTEEAVAREGGGQAFEELSVGRAETIVYLSSVNIKLGNESLN